MTRVASHIIPIRAPLKVETGAARAMKVHGCQETGTEDLNLEALVSSNQKPSREGLQKNPSLLVSRTGSQAMFTDR